jgi:hypothetical protein
MAGLRFSWTPVDWFLTGVSFKSSFGTKKKTFESRPFNLKNIARVIQNERLGKTLAMGQFLPPFSCFLLFSIVVQNPWLNLSQWP